MRSCRRQRFLDAVNGVMVAEREQLHAGCGGGRHQFRDRQLAIGVVRVRLQLDAFHGS